ncbi:fibulin-1 isoform X2 [Patella vulgata]|uniref:fibulin-1 isoform X2 n=1 Tax=Patella vulgata TaxID=6465 RepID=UPI0021800270|nr:fibulin-1 isoform X2 [Patella vulgata]XP_050414608.1 fibulin-1 isoform X2 [Patella vulgata]
MKYFVCVILLLSLNVELSLGDLNDVLIKCCHEGLDWSIDDNRCDRHPGYVANVSMEDQSSCLSIVELCCIKDVLVKRCAKGKENALEGMMCAIRDSEQGSEQYKECCICCQLGLLARSQGLSCRSPNYGAPCDNMFLECCTGQVLADIYNATGTDQSDVDVVNDRDECALFPGQICSHRCVNTPGSFRCECRGGYTLNQDGRTCQESKDDDTDYGNVNDGYSCEENSPCEQRCANTDLGVKCNCYEGYKLRSDGRSCEDVDECAEGSFKCAPTQECVNTLGRYTCHTTKCQTGYVYNPINRRCEESYDCDRGFGFNSVTRQCEDIDECTVYENICVGVYQFCRNFNGSYTCECEEGFQLNRDTRQCEDINECGLGIDTCRVGERCDNTIGSYSCRRFRHCGTGYTLDEATQRCLDHDECLLGTHNCGRGYDCVNVQGSFKCEVKQCAEGSRFNTATGECDRVQCARGLRPDRIGNCIDINECNEYTTVCNKYQQCINTIGSYQCRSLINCGNGYETNENGRCTDIDECSTGVHRCAGEQQCINRQGSYFCQCPRGYRFINNLCEDVDECAYSAAICPLQSKCQNTPGSYVCTCKDGLESDGRGGCNDVDECTTRNICHHKCINNFGSYFCTCNRGYQLSVDQRTCEDIDECNQFAGRGRVCGGRCVNTPGSFTCDCPDGWKKARDGRACEDIDECSDGTAYCPSRDSTCVNTRGGYKCPLVQCPEGFVKTIPGGQQNSVRCKQVGMYKANSKGLISLSYNFLTFPTNIIIPTPLFSMTGAKDSQRDYRWELKIVSARPLAPGIPRATESNFELTQTNNQAVVTLKKRIRGPQDVILQLLMKISSEKFNGIAESKIYLYVTDGPSTFR